MSPLATVQLKPAGGVLKVRPIPGKTGDSKFPLTSPVPEALETARQTDSAIQKFREAFFICIEGVKDLLVIPTCFFADEIFYIKNKS